MLFKDWRIDRNLTLNEAARLLGLEGVNPGGTLARFETGARAPDADMVERIERLTEGAVSAADMHAVRLAWLKQNRPEKFEAPMTEAAE